MDSKISLSLRNRRELLIPEQFEEWCQRNVPGYPSGGGLLRFDGLYRDQDEKDNGNDYLRFYPDGTVLDVAVRAPSTAEQVAQWLGKNKRGISRGKYKRRGTQIAFTTRSGRVAISYVGMVVNDHTIALEFYSHATTSQGLTWYSYEQGANLVP
ncbi:MAG: hypothetical protein J2P36_33285 [Ktedonobacteraceae bacterium]|nr:hypothetical protein [Ktedonobacteraceae bacterium]